MNPALSTQGRTTREHAIRCRSGRQVIKRLALTCRARPNGQCRSAPRAINTERPDSAQVSKSKGQSVLIINARRQARIRGMSQVVARPGCGMSGPHLSSEAADRCKRLDNSSSSTEQDPRLDRVYLASAVSTGQPVVSTSAPSSRRASRLPRPPRAPNTFLRLSSTAKGLINGHP